MGELTDGDESIEVCLRSGRSLDICNSGRSSNRDVEESLEGSGGKAIDTKASFDYCYKGLAPPRKDDVPAVLKDAQRRRGRFGQAESRANKAASHSMWNQRMKG